MTRFLGVILLAAALSAPGFPPATAQDNQPTQVIVLSVLHQLHGEIEGYDFDVLAQTIERLHPDVLAVELTAADLESRREQPNKQEYQRSVFPLLDRHGYDAVPLEPDQPRYDELVGLFRGAAIGLRQDHPDRAESFDLFVQSLYQLLEEKWVSPSAVNSRETDLLFESKHRFQGLLFGPDERAAWEGWNQHFLQQILKATAGHPGKRILVLVGAEHAYWLRSQLSGRNLELLDTAALLSSSAGIH